MPSAQSTSLFLKAYCYCSRSSVGGSWISASAQASTDLHRFLRRRHPTLGARTEGVQHRDLRNILQRRRMANSRHRSHRRRPVSRRSIHRRRCCRSSERRSEERLARCSPRDVFHCVAKRLSRIHRHRHIRCVHPKRRGANLQLRASLPFHGCLY